MSGTPRPFVLPAWLRLLRPAQWLKNGVVPAAYVFARWDPGQCAAAAGWGPVLSEALAVACFCLLSSGVYVMNDLRDREADRHHPLKRLRPLASGEISPATGVCVSLVLMAASLAAGGLLLPRAFFGVLGGYLLMQVCYTYALKRVPYVDIFVISLGFVLRAVAGATAIGVRISPWLLLCTFLLSLFLALCKRRHEKVQLEAAEGELHREALAGYDRQLLDIQICMTAASTLVCYSIYTLSEETAARFGTHALGLTIPFVVFGIFRYLELVYRHEGGGRPERVLLTDKVMIATVLGYVLTVLAVFVSLGG
jgi:4-hydroxybenzoate polyprenyltransferase